MKKYEKKKSAYKKLKEKERVDLSEIDALTLADLRKSVRKYFTKNYAKKDSCGNNYRCKAEECYENVCRFYVDIIIKEIK